MDSSLQQQYLQYAVEAARLAGEIQHKNFGGHLEKFTKTSGIDLVTNVDRECDELIRAYLVERCPDALFFTEESYVDSQEVDLSNTWVVDPLDGTTNYTHSFPHFAVSIAYFKDGDQKIGVIYDPMKDELFHATRGGGMFLNGKPAKVSGVDELSSALIGTGFPYDIVKDSSDALDYFKRIVPRCQGVRRPGAAALDLAYLAVGRLDGFWEFKLSLWDVAAGCLMVEEAGGLVRDLCGNPLNYNQAKINIMGANRPHILESILDVLGEHATIC